MKLTNAEKLILVMLAELHEKLGVNGQTDPKFLQNAIYRDHTWALSQEMSGIVGDSPDPAPPEVGEVFEFLGMWESIEMAYASFNASEKKQIKEDARRFGNNVNFPGFDGNNESRYMSIAQFVVKDMDLYSHFMDHNFNSHCPMVGDYRAMLEVFSPMCRALGNQHLGVPQVIEILNAGVIE